MPITTVEQALQYMEDRIQQIRSDALITRDLGTALFVWRTNERNFAGDELLIEACNEHARQMEGIGR